MSKYAFRLRFFVRGEPLLETDKDTLLVQLAEEDKAFTLTPLQGASTLGEASWFALCGIGYPTIEEAEHDGNRLKNALCFLNIRLNRFFDIGKDRPTSVSNDALKRHLEETAREHGQQVRVYDNVHGLMVFPEHPQPIVPEIFGSGTVQAPPGPSFEFELKEAYTLDLKLNERISLACNLYGASHIEGSPRAKFLMLVSTIESLLERSERAPKAVELVDNLIKITQDSGLDSSEKSSLIESLKWLKFESYNRMGKRLVREHLGHRQYSGMDAESFFRHCYSIRSQLLHHGKPASDDVQMAALASHLDRLVADLLEHICRNAVDA